MTTTNNPFSFTSPMDTKAVQVDTSPESYDPEEAIENLNDTDVDEADIPNSELDGDFFDVPDAVEVDGDWEHIDLNDYKEETE